MINYHDRGVPRQAVPLTLSAQLQKPAAVGMKDLSLPTLMDKSAQPFLTSVLVDKPLVEDSGI